MRRHLMHFSALLCLSLAGTVTAQESDGLTAEQEAALSAFWESLDRRTGTIALGDGLATLEVPDDFYFLPSEDANRVLVDLWGNPPDQGDGLLGMLFPERYKPFDEGSWAVVVEYVDDGYVSDSDAAEIDYDDLLAGMKRDVRAANGDRVAAGYEEIDLLGWAEPPHYDATTHKLYWAKELRFGDSPFTTLNYEIRALGRRGILNMTFIAATEKLGEINGSREAVLAMASFDSGQRYEDFDSSIDEVAAYGIGALIAGKVAAKAGLLTAGLVLLKKFGIFLLIGVAAVGRKLKTVLAPAA